MEVQPSKPTSKGPSEWFTGDVWIDVIAQSQGTSPATFAFVHFSPEAEPHGTRTRSVNRRTSSKARDVFSLGVNQT